MWHRLSFPARTKQSELAMRAMQEKRDQLKVDM